MKYCALLALLFLTGCAGSYRAIQPREETWDPEKIVERYLERGSWQSFSCKFKVKFEAGDSAMSAKGIMLFVTPEKFSLGFRKPYHYVLGDLYFTPTQTIYWGPQQSLTFQPDIDTLTISQLIPFELPRWAPRDLLPFPIAARTAGLQMLDTKTDSLGRVWLQGECGSARHELLLDRSRGTIESEYVQRQGGDFVRKNYLKTLAVNDYPMPSRVVCEDLDGSHRLTWTLYDIELKPAPYSLSN